MMKSSYPTLSLFLLVLLLHLSFRPLHAQQVEDQREFDYINGSAKGPENWGYLKNEWSVCNTGQLQSPVEIGDDAIILFSWCLGELRKQYWASQAVIKNRGHDIAVEWQGEAGSIQINGSQYKLRELHWHSPSEHVFFGTRHPLEVHMVHQTDDPAVENKIAVFAMLYEFGRPDPFIAELLKNVTLKRHGESDGEVRGVKQVDPNEVRMAGERYFRYIGSLTTPPCTEGVHWTINQKRRTVSREQVTALREAVHDYARNNARPLQPLYKRAISYYSPIDKLH